MPGVGKVLSDMAAELGMSPAQQDILRRLDSELGQYSRSYNIMAAWGMSIKPNFPRGITGAGTIPSGTIAIFDAACPTGWTRVSAFDGKAVRGASTYGGTGGTDSPTMPSHDHGGSTSSGGSHTHSTTEPWFTDSRGAGVYTTAVSTAGGTSGSGGSHSHTVTSESSGSTNWPQYINVVYCKFNG